MPDSIRTTVVGSYPVPSWLITASRKKEAFRDALSVVLKAQEEAGIDVLTDGEISRFDPSHPETNGMIEYFISGMAGISTRLTREEVAQFQSQAGMAFRKQPAGVVRAKVGEGHLYLRGAFDEARFLTKKPLKFTLTSPYMLAKTLLNSHYSDFEQLVMDLAESLRRQVTDVDSPVVQIDEANLPGHPQDWPIASLAINHVLSGVDAGKEKGVHLCFGNYGGQTIQKGTWKDLLSFLNNLECDHLLLEFARRGDSELEFLRDLKPSISLGIGIIDIKDNQIETPERVAQRLETCLKALGTDRIRWACPDCGFWMLSRPVADGKMRSLVKGRDLVLGTQT